MEQSAPEKPGLQVQVANPQWQKELDESHAPEQSSGHSVAGMVPSSPYTEAILQSTESIFGGGLELTQAPLLPHAEPLNPKPYV